MNLKQQIIRNTIKIEWCWKYPSKVPSWDDYEVLASAMAEIKACVDHWGETDSSGIKFNFDRLKEVTKWCFEYFEKY